MSCLSWSAVSAALTGVDRRIPLTATVDGALTLLAAPRDAPG
jgi:hypothetical protein